MATLTINPNAAGDITNISTVTGAATHWQAVSKGSVSDTSFVSDTGVAGTFVGDLYKFDTAALSGKINSVTLFARIAREANGFMVQNFSLKTNGTTFDYTWTDPANGAFDTQNSGVLTTNPQTTLAWTLSDVRNIHCLLYTSPSPRDRQKSRMPSSA